MVRNMFVTILLVLVSSVAIAKDMTVDCSVTKSKNNAQLIDGKTIRVEFDSRSVTVTPLDSSEGKLSGKFHKTAKNGSSVYNSEDVQELSDQTDQGFIFISKSLVRGRSGQVTLSNHQLGDSEGAWWNDQVFNCKVR